MLAQAGHTICGRRVVRDDTVSIASAVEIASEGMDDPEVIVITGGTGITSRDRTPEAVRPLLSKEMPGFGEVFRQLSWDEVGPASVLSRAFAGVMGRTLIFALPGSVNAVRLAMDKLIVPELGHFAREVRPEHRREE
jgi:molybdenum cofactor biosynthesis protein B